jgi:hypothetical protein
MSDKVFEALTAVEKARVAALECAIASRAYRLCAILDTDGQVQRAVNRCQKMLNGKETPPVSASKSKKK